MTDKPHVLYNYGVALLGSGLDRRLVHDVDVFLGSEKAIRDKCLAGRTRWHIGVNRNRQTYWTSPIGLIFQADDLPEPSQNTEPVIEPQDAEHWKIGYPLPIDWHYQSLMKKEFLSFIPYNTQEMYRYTTKGALEIHNKEHEALMNLMSTLAKMNVDITDENIKLFKRIEGFDYYYHYSDDGAVYRSGVAREKKLLEDLETVPPLLQLFKGKFKQ